ncbi:hypothetical protein BGZ94_007366 [Podila epigama]|nr:hypothetical protein BGZ94_007366 [Podila epigama]
MLTLSCSLTIRHTRAAFKPLTSMSLHSNIFSADNTQIPVLSKDTAKSTSIPLITSVPTVSEQEGIDQIMVTPALCDKTTSENLRRVLRKVPFPVVIVSTCSPVDPTQRRGITVSSFTSISLKPIPLIAFCVKLPSRASTALHEANQFVVQFLAEDQIAHSVAFSSSVAPPKGVTAKRITQDKEIEALVQEAEKQTLNSSNGETRASTQTPPVGNNSSTSSSTDLDPFTVLGYETDPESNLPVLKNTLGAIRCKAHQVLNVGDHEMWIGHVEKVLYGDIPGEPDQDRPLLYHDRSYRKVGRRIV